MTVFSFFSFSLFMTVFSFISFSLFMTVVSFFRISYPVVQCKRRSKGFLPTEVPVAHWSDVQTLPRPGSLCACYLDDTDPTLLTYWSGCHLPPKVCAWQNAAGVSFPGQVIYWSAHTHLRSTIFGKLKLTNYSVSGSGLNITSRLNITFLTSSVIQIANRFSFVSLFVQFPSVFRRYVCKTLSTEKS